jgi:hypothetical protein
VGAVVESLFWVGWIAFFVWTIGHLWRPIDSEYAKLVYLFGVRAAGIGCSVLAPIFALESNFGSSDPELRKLVIVGMALIGPPLWLWAGYVSGRMLALMIGVTKDTQ